MSVLGCGLRAEPEDGRNDSFLDGKADTAGIEEGSPEALGILAVANTVSDEILRERPPDGVGLGDRAVDNLIYIRLGDDGLPGTGDDGHLDTLAELDAVPFIGPIAFAKLLAYARDHGYVDAECPARCEPELVARGSSPSAIVVDDTHIYWTDTIGKVMRLAKTGGEPEQIGTGGAFGIAVDATHVYWTHYTSSGLVQRRSKSLGPIEDVATDQAIPDSIVVDATHVYWTTFDSDTVMRRAITPALGAIETVATGQDGAGGLSIDETHVYWVARDVVMRRSKAPGPVEQIAANQIGALYTALDATHVYWSTLTDGTVMRRSKALGPIETFAGEEEGVEQVAVDAEGVYWTMLTDIGGIRHRSKAGGPPANVADDPATDGIALDAEYIYWTAEEPSDLRSALSGRVMRLARCACGL